MADWTDTDFTIGDYMGQDGAVYWTTEILKRIKNITYDFDYKPTHGSSNLVNSGNIYDFVMGLISGVVGVDVRVSPIAPTAEPEHPDKTVYLVLVPDEAGSGTNLYIEYLWVQAVKKWERLGSTTVDLTDYAKKTDVGNGTLALYYGETLLGTFSANERTGKQIRIPEGGGTTPGDGTITIKQGTTTLGTFTVNQATNKTITIPAPETPGNGTITLMSDGAVIDTFTMNQSADKTINIPAGGGGGGDERWVDGNPIVHNKNTKSSVDARAISNGTLNYTTDTRDLYLDSGGQRIKISDYIVINSEAERTALTNPIEDKLYIVVDTHTLWTYHNGWWSMLSYGDIQTRNILLSTFSIALGSNTQILGTDQLTNWMAVGTMMLVSERVYLTNSAEFRFIVSQLPAAEAQVIPAIYKYSGKTEGHPPTASLVCAGVPRYLDKLGWYTTPLDSQVGIKQPFLDPGEIYYYVYLHNSNGTGLPGFWRTQMNEPPYVAFCQYNLGDIGTAPETIELQSESTLTVYGSLFANALGNN